MANQRPDSPVEVTGSRPLAEHSVASANIRSKRPSVWRDVAKPLALPHLCVGCRGLLLDRRSWESGPFSKSADQLRNTPSTSTAAPNAGQLLVAAGDRIRTIAPQLLAEFIHVVTDARLFSQPLGMDEAREIAEQWWTASEVERVFPDDTATQQFLSWLQQFSLGRKRLLDTLLAATYYQARIHSILTTNASDFSIFGVFSCITPSTGLSPL